MRISFIIILSAFLYACSSVSVNESYYPYVVSEEKTLPENARIIIATNNLGKPSRNYIKRFEERVDNVLKNKLRENGYTIVSSRIYNAAHEEAIATFGSPFNTSTGKLNNQKLNQVISYTVNKLRENNTVDAIIFTDLLEKQSSVIIRESKRFTRFDGVQRNMKVQGAGSSANQDFDWNNNVDVISLAVNVFHIDGQRLLHNMAGLDNADAIDTRKQTFSRSRSIMKDDKYIIEAVDLALHPLIFSKLYVEPETSN